MIPKLSVLALAFAAWGYSAEPSSFKVMTQNMDAGTDLTYAVYELLGVCPGPAGTCIDWTYQEVLASRIPERTQLLAKAIARTGPELLGLQEATLWRTGDSAATATNVLVDQLNLLVADLAALGVPYDIVAVNTLTDIAVPKISGGYLRITDRDVLLVRSDLRPPDFHLSDVHSNKFDAFYEVNGAPPAVTSGWISVMVHTGNRICRVITTHLQGPVGPDPTALAVQKAQAEQLINELRNSTIPVILSGDFNSDAIPGTRPGPDNTDTAAMIQAAGYADVTTALLPTWPLYLEDQIPPNFFGHSVPWERIDLVFQQGMNVVSAERVLAPNTAANVWPYFGSDHAGVIATFQF